MTLGEKLRVARKNAGLTQEQLAEKLMVSRQAVTKWESDKGLPDVENLKMIANLLNVSIDYLLDRGETMDKPVLRETYDLSAYGKGLKKTRKDRVMREKFPDTEIITLLGELKLTKVEKIVGNSLGFFTDAPFGIPAFINSVKNMDKEFYLVNRGDQQFLVMVTDEFIESREMPRKTMAKTFEVGEWKFRNCGPIKN